VQDYASLVFFYLTAFSDLVTPKASSAPGLPPAKSGPGLTCPIAEDLDMSRMTISIN